MSSRYTGRRVVRNVSKIYEDLRKRRGVSHIEQYKTPKLRHPSAMARTNFIREKYIWKLGDRYWKLAAEHYGSATYWWVIAWYNQRPVENMLNDGDTIIIPKPLQTVLESLKYY